MDLISIIIPYYKKKHFVSLTETALIPIKGHKKFCAKNGTQNDSYIF